MATDDFNRADASDLGANWTPQTGSNDLEIVSNQTATIGSTPYINYYDGAGAVANDQFSQATVSGQTVNATWIGVVVRASDSAETHYSF
jgi:hypothetical protein